MCCAGRCRGPRRRAFTFYTHPEIEFFLFEELTEGESAPVPVDSGGYFDHTTHAVARDFRRQAVLALERIGISVEFSHHEVAPGQQEIDLRYADALTTADNIMTFRHVIKEVALSHGVHASFMPKPFTDQPGSGMHTHLSLFEGERNAFHDPSDPMKLSKVGQAFIAGLLRHAREFTAVTNQWVNSYKRLFPAGARRPDHRGSGVCLLGASATGPRWSGCRRTASRTRPGSRSAPWTPPATRTWPSRSCSAPGSKGSRRGTSCPRGGGRRVGPVRRGAPGRGLFRCRRTSPRRSRSWPDRTWSPRCSASTSSTSSCGTSAPSGRSTAESSPRMNVSGTSGCCNRRMTRPGRGSGQLARYGFLDVERAAELLSVADSPGTAGPSGYIGLGLWNEASSQPTDPTSERLLETFALAADPDLALKQLCRLVASAEPDLLPALGADPRLRRRLIVLLGVSSALGDYLIANPDQWQALAGDALAWPRGYQDADTSTVPALRIAYHRVLMRIVVGDLTGAFDIEIVMARLSDLADATLQAALAIASQERAEDAAACRLAVIAMGKCGGGELNYVSDVDVVFVAEPSVEPSAGIPGADVCPESADDQQAHAVRAASALAVRLMRICGTVAWPIDAALRPEGNQGSLVRTLAAYHTYYTKWAKTWEFQALLKARPAVGDRDLGLQWLGRSEPHDLVCR